ncbi:leucine-rich repeat domain-containing protein [bacterium]|nr:leucine-rich repeat domain-containing protein [bacterium]
MKKIFVFCLIAAYLSGCAYAGCFPDFCSLCREPFEYKSKSNEELPAIHYDAVGDVLVNLHGKESFNVFFEEIRLGMGDGATKAQRDYLKHARRITILGCIYSGIESIPEEIVQLKKLRIMDFRLNKLVALPKGVSKLLKLESINLSGNNFNIYPVEVSILSALVKHKINCNLLENPMNGILDFKKTK